MRRTTLQSYFAALLIAISCTASGWLGANHADRELSQRRTSFATEVVDRLVVQQDGATIHEYHYSMALPTAWHNVYWRTSGKTAPSDQPHVLPVEYVMIEPGGAPRPLFSLIAMPADAWNDAAARGYYHGTAMAIRDGLVFAYVLPSQPHDAEYSPIYSRMTTDVPLVLSSFKLQDR